MHIRALQAVCASLMAVVLGLSPNSAAADDELIERVDSQIAAWQPTAQERQMDRIAWVADIRTGRRVADELQRPIFLFTLDGRMDTGRQ